jgi:predicted Zn-dependent protease
MHHNSIAGETDSLISVTWQKQSASELLMQIGEWLELRSSVEDAKHYYEAALRVDPNHSFAAWKLGQMNLKNGEYNQAVLHLNHASRLAPDHAPTYYLLSLAYSGTGQTEYALDAAENALKYNANNAGAFLQKLRMLAQLKRWQEINDVRNSSVFSSQLPNEIYLWYALASLHLNDVDTARMLFEKVSPKTRKLHRDVAEVLEAQLTRTTS